MGHQRQFLSVTAVLCFLAFLSVHFLQFPVNGVTWVLLCMLSFTGHSVLRVFYAFYGSIVYSFLLQGRISLTFVWVWGRGRYIYVKQKDQISFVAFLKITY